MTISRSLVLLLLLLCAGCPLRPPAATAGADDGPSDPAADDDALGDDDDALGDDDDSTAAPWPDPFAARPDTSAGLVNTSANLQELLEFGALTTACADSAASPADGRLRLLCGKAMFFYEGFDTVGIPEALYDFMATNFAPELGLAFSELGLIPDPYSPEGRSLGVAPGAPLNGGSPTLAFNCASCHFGQLPDGRYSVGAANHDYAYGEHMLALLLLPMAAAPGFAPSDHHPDAIAAVQPALDRLTSDFMLQLQMGLAMLPLLSEGGAPPLGAEYEGLYASWLPGTMDFVMPPLPLDDGVHTISKIIDLWDIPTVDEEIDAGMDTAHLAWTGGADSLMTFLDGFVAVGGGDREYWTPERLGPLHDYILSLRAPANPAPPTPSATIAGEAVFMTQGCVDCHQGPGGAGLRTFTFEEIGTDDALMYFADPDLTGTPCCGFDSTGTTALTHGIKAPRLTGLWGKTRFLHNGALGTLRELLCLEPRPAVSEPAYGSQGHTFGCDLASDDREALLAYLLAH